MVKGLELQNSYACFFATQNTLLQILKASQTKSGCRFGLCGLQPVRTAATKVLH